MIANLYQLNTKKIKSSTSTKLKNFAIIHIIPLIFIALELRVSPFFKASFLLVIAALKLKCNIIPEATDPRSIRRYSMCYWKCC